MPGNVAVSNTMSLYQNSGNTRILNNAQQLLNTLSNNGNVGFALDSLSSNTKVLAYALVAPSSGTPSGPAGGDLTGTYPNPVLVTTGVSAGTYGSDSIIPQVTVDAKGRVTSISNVTAAGGSYGNTQVAAYLPIYTGSLAQSTTIVAIDANLGTATTNITALQANAGTQQTEINSLIANAGSQATAISNLQANAGTQQSEINSLTANAATQQTEINTLTANAGTQATQIITLNANLGAFQTYANATFSTGGGSSYGNANVAAYLPTYDGNIGGALQTYITAKRVSAVDGFFWSNGTAYSTGGTSTYGNTEVAAYLPTYTGSLAQSSTIQTLDANLGTATTNITNLQSNAATQATQIATLDANLGTATTNITTLFANAATQATAINTINANLGTATNNITTLFANAATQATAIQTLDANLGTATTNITTLFANAASQAQTLANLGTMSTQNATAVNITGGNISAYNVTATNKLASPYLDATTSAGGALRNASGTAQLQWGSGGGNNLSMDVSTNMNGTNAQISISPTGTGHVHIKPTGANSLEIAPTFTGSMNNVTIGNITPAAAILTTLQTSGNITANAGAYFIGDGSKLTGITASGTYGLTGDVTASGTLGSNAVASLSATGVAAGTYGSDTLIPQITVDSKGRVTTISNVSAAGGGYGNTQVAAYLNGSAPTISSAAATNLIITGGTNSPGSGAILNLVPTGSVGGFTGPVAYFNTTNLAVASGYISTSYGPRIDDYIYDTVKGRVFANAFPLSTANLSIPANGTSRFIVNTPTYTSGVLQQPPLANATPGGTGIVATSSQVIGFVQTANVGFQSGYGFGNQNRDTLGALFQTTITPVTANSMSNTDRVRGAVGAIDLVMTGQSYGSMTSGSQGATTLAGINGFVNINGWGNVSTAIGGTYGSFITPAANQTANIQYSTSIMSFLTLQSTAGTSGRANVVYHRAVAPFISGMGANLTVQNAVGLHTYSGWAGSGTVGTSGNPVVGRWALLNEDANTTIQTNGNVTITGNTSLAPYTESQQDYGNTGGTINFSVYSAAGSVKSLTLTSNLTVNTNNVTLPKGGTLTLIIRQDATGNRTLTSNIKFAGGSKTLSTTANAIDTISIYNDGTDLLAALVKGYS